MGSRANSELALAALIMPKSSGKEKKAKKSLTSGEKPWTRVTKGGANTKADTREVDVAQIEALLTKRTHSKQVKDYALADGTASELQRLGICYIDERKEWYTKVIEESKPLDSKSVDGNKSKRKREDPKEVPAAEEIDDDAPTSDDDDSEDDREDDALVARMQLKISKQNKTISKDSSGETKEGAKSKHADIFKEPTAAQKKKKKQAKLP